MNSFNYPSNEQLSQGDLWCLRHVPVISTAHITAQDGQRLRANATSRDCVMDHDPDGAWHMVNTTAGVSVFASAEYNELLNAFADKGYPWIILDADGDKIEGVPTFDW